MLRDDGCGSIAPLTRRYRADLSPEGRGEAEANSGFSVASQKGGYPTSQFTHTNEGENHD